MDTLTEQNAAIVAAAKSFLALLTGKPMLEETRLAVLEISLIQLAIAYHNCANVDPSDDVLEAPKVDYDILAVKAASSFPELGYYPTVDLQDTTEQDFCLADGIDDLADIARDLTEVLWYSKNVGFTEAI